MLSYPFFYCRYTPSFDLSLDLEDAFKEDKPEVNKDASEDAEGGEEESSASAAAPIGSPNIMEAGLTKEALERLGYKFKDGKAVSEVKEAPRPETALPQQERKKKTSLAAAESPLSVGYRSNFNTPGTGGNSFSTTTDDDTPRPIIKKTSNNGGGAGTDVGYRTPAGADDHSPYPVPKPREFHGHHPPPHEASRIEITPGLFVRRPAASGSGRNRGASSSDGRGGTTPMRKEVALKNMAAGKEGDSPKMPELQTVNLQELLAEKSRSQSKVYTPSPAKKGPAANEDEEPPTPDLKTLNLREILQPKENLEQSLGANRTLEGAENRDPASMEEKLTPDTPEFKDKFIRELARSGKKGAPTPRGRLQGAAAQEEELLGASLSVAPVASPGSPQMPALSSDISKYYFDRETHL